MSRKRNKCCGMRMTYHKPGCFYATHPHEKMMPRWPQEFTFSVDPVAGDIAASTADFQELSLAAITESSLMHPPMHDYYRYQCFNGEWIRKTPRGN